MRRVENCSEPTLATSFKLSLWDYNNYIRLEHNASNIFQKKPKN